VIQGPQVVQFRPGKIIGAITTALVLIGENNKAVPDRVKGQEQSTLTRILHYFSIEGIQCTEYFFAPVGSKFFAAQLIACTI
jgi:hypothetical protein